MNNTSLLINLSLKINNRNDLNYYKKFKDNFDKPIDSLEEEQLKQFHKLFSFCKQNVPSYSNLFSKLKLQVTDFKTISDLKKIPLLDKQIILENYIDFLPRNYNNKFFNGATGGSTGEPLKYRMSGEDYSKGIALLYRGLNQGGYSPGDKIAILAGGSLVKNKSSYKSKLTNVILNYKKFSSYGVSDQDLDNYYKTLKNWQPKFLRGYASSLTLFAKYCLDNNKDLNFKSVFSTAEMLLPVQRQLIEKAFNTTVYNNYGLNDGGVSAYEIGTKDEFIIDTERSVLEIVNESENIFNVNGKIVATSLYNYAFPFIRYDTGDNGTQILNPQSSEKRKILTNLRGRTTDFIVIGNKTIGSPVLTVLMGKIDAIKYQIIQKKDQSLEIRILKGKDYSKDQEDFIKKSLTSNIDKNLKLNFIYTDVFIKSNNKHKFIIKE